MQYQRLGHSGLKLSRLSFGAWVTFGQQIGEEVATELMKAAYDAGVNFFDNAEAYANGNAEVVMGAILKKLGWRRDSYCVSSKVFFGIDERKPTQRGCSRKHLTDACHGALERFQLDYIDLFYCHRHDPETPIEETVSVMTDLIRQGKILYWGTSEWSAREITEAHAVARQYNLYPPTMEQPQYHLFHRERFEVEYAPLYDAPFGMGTTIWSPLASGLLTGKFSGGQVPEGSRMGMEGMEWLAERLSEDWGKAIIERADRLKPLAEELGMTLPRMAIAWVLKNPHVSSAILGASKPAQLVENLKAIDDVEQLSDEVMAKIEAIAESAP
ncbi:MAG: potassium channel beta subunit family protein [Opitutales bacterium]